MHPDKIRAHIAQQHPELNAIDCEALVAHAIKHHPGVERGAELPAKPALPTAVSPFPHIDFHRAWLQRWIIAGILLLGMLISAVIARAQSTGGVIVQGSNSSSLLVTRSAGLINFKCDGTTVICNWSAATNTFTFTGAGGGGGVSNVSFTGGLISVATPTTTPAFTVAGTSGGIPYFNSASTWDTSAAGVTGAMMAWGGAGVAPKSPLSLLVTNQNSATETWTLYNSTATTGVTNFALKAGAGQTTNAINTIQYDALGAATSQGLVLQNTTPAATGAQQYSPSLTMIGQGWRALATAASQPVRWDMFVQPIQVNSNSALAGGALVFSPSVNSTGLSSVALCTVSASNYGATIQLNSTNANGGCGDWNSNLQGGDSGIGPTPGRVGFAMYAGAKSGGGEIANVSVNGFLMKNTAAVMFASGDPNNASTGDVSVDRDAVGTAAIYNGTAPGTTAANYRDLKLRHEISAGTAPTLTAGFGTSPTIAGGDESIAVTVGTGGTATTGTVTFGSAYASAPNCIAGDNSSLVQTRATTTTTTVVLNSGATPWGAGDVISILCRGHQ